MIFQILPKSTYRFDQEALLMMLKGLSAKEKRKNFWKSIFEDLDYSFVVDCDGEGKKGFYFCCLDDRKEMIQNILNVFLKDGGDAYIVKKDILEPYDVVDTLFLPERDSDDRGQTLATFKNDALFMTLLGMLVPYSRIRIDFKVTKAAVTEGRMSFFRSSNDVELQAVVQVLGKTKYQRTDIMRISNQICSLTAGNKILQVKYRNRYIESIFTGAEIMNLFQIPTLAQKREKEIEDIYHLLPGQKSLQPQEFSSGLRFGKLHHPQMDRDVYVSLSKMREHLIISGSTGSGKSSAIEEMIDDILRKKARGDKNVPGFTFLDPAETSVLGVIDRILKIEAEGVDVSALLKKVRYVDFSYDEYVFPISILNKGIRSTEIIDFFQSLYGDMKTIQVDRMVTSAINVLMNDDQEHVIDDISRIFQDANFREELSNRLRGNIYAKDSLIFLQTKFNPNQTEPILNRTDPFKNTSQKKLMFGMTSRYDALKDIRKWMDEGYIILMNIKGMGDFDRKVICGYMALQYYMQTLNRPANSLVHFLINDESHHLQLPIYPRIAAELRKQGLSLVLMTQFLQQYSPAFLNSLLDNINTIVSFKQGDESSGTLARKIRSGDVTADALKSLSQFIGYVSTEDNGKEKSVLIKVRPPYRYTDGKPVPYEDPKAVEANEKKNRTFARKLMARDFMSKEQAEKIVFARHYEEEAFLEEEQQLLTSGDSALPIDPEKEKEGESIWDD